MSEEAIRRECKAGTSSKSRKYSMLSGALSPNEIRHCKTKHRVQALMTSGSQRMTICGQLAQYVPVFATI